jgi:hypothetical protein
MKSIGCLLLLIASLSPALVAAPQTQATVDQSNDVRLPSPDGRWEVDSTPSPTTDGNSQLVLKAASGKHTFHLGEFFRSGTLIWSQNSRVVLFLDRHSPEDTRLRMFFVPHAGGGPTDRADREIRRGVLRSIGRSNSILSYDLQVTSCSENECLVLTRVITIPNGVVSGPAKQWEGTYLVQLAPLKVNRTAAAAPSSPAAVGW